MYYNNWYDIEYNKYLLNFKKINQKYYFNNKVSDDVIIKNLDYFLYNQRVSALKKIISHDDKNIKRHILNFYFNFNFSVSFNKKFKNIMYIMLKNDLSLLEEYKNKNIVTYKMYLSENNIVDFNILKEDSILKYYVFFNDKEMNFNKFILSLKKYNCSDNDISLILDTISFNFSNIIKTGLKNNKFDILSKEYYLIVKHLKYNYTLHLLRNQKYVEIYQLCKFLNNDTFLKEILNNIKNRSFNINSINDQSYKIFINDLFSDIINEKNLKYQLYSDDDNITFTNYICNYVNKIKDSNDIIKKIVLKFPNLNSQILINKLSKNNFIIYNNIILNNQININNKKHRKKL